MDEGFRTVERVRMERTDRALGHRGLVMIDVDPMLAEDVDARATPHGQRFADARAWGDA